MALMHGELTEQIIACAVRVHKALGPGLLESAYEVCLAHELGKAGVDVQRQVPIPIVYDGIHLETGFRADLIVARAVIVEIKAIDKLIPIHEAQLITHLKLCQLRVGLLINFNCMRLVDGIIRRVL